MTRRNNFLPFLFATATGAMTAAAVIQYQKQKAVALKTLAENSAVIETRRGPMEVAVAGKGDPVVVIHGVLASYQHGLVIGEALAEAGYQVIAISRFGYERSPLPEDASPAAQADTIAALLDALNIQQAAMVGVSAGGPSAAEFAIRHPERTSALIMMAAATQPRDVHAEETHTPAMSMLLFGYTSDVFLWLMIHYELRMLPFSVVERPTLQSLLDRPALMSMYRRLSWGLWPAANRRAGVDNDIAQIKRLKLSLKKIAAPTLVLHGTDDQLVPYETGLYTASQIPGAAFVRFEHGEHGFFVNQHDEAWPPIIDFLKATKKKAAPKKAASIKSGTPKPAAKKPSPARTPAATDGKKPAARKRTVRKTS